MINREQINEKMVVCIEHTIEEKNGQVTFDNVAKNVIKEISEYAKTTSVFKSNVKRGEFFKEYTSSQIWLYLLDRVVNAPTSFHLICSVIMIIPFLEEKLAGKE